LTFDTLYYINRSNPKNPKKVPIKKEVLIDILENNTINNSTIDIVHWANIMFEPSKE